MTVISVGSATGTITGRGWYNDKATLNILEVRDDESVWLVTHRGLTENSFTSTQHIKLFDSVDLRRAHYYNCNPKNATAHAIKIHAKHMDNQDVVVYRTLYNAKLNNKPFTFNVYSETGKPEAPEVWIDTTNGTKVTGDITDGFFVNANRAHTWKCQATFPDTIGDANVNITSKYKWTKAWMQSREQVNNIPEEERGFFYNNYLESFYSVTPKDINMPARLDISVDLPLKWTPDNLPGNVVVYVKHASQEVPRESPELTKLIYSNGEGYFAISIDYPTPTTTYYLAWKIRGTAR